MALIREHYSIKVAATMLIGILLLSTVDTIHAQTQVTARGDEYRPYYGFKRYGLINNFPDTWTNDIVYDHNNNRIILTDHTLNEFSKSLLIYDDKGNKLHSMYIPLNYYSSVEYDHVNNRIIVGGVFVDRKIGINVYDGSNYQLISRYALERGIITDVVYDSANGRILAAVVYFDEDDNRYRYRVTKIDDAGNFVPIMNFDDCPVTLDYVDVRPLGLLYDSRNQRIFVFCNFEDENRAGQYTGRIYVMRYNQSEERYVITAGPFDMETEDRINGIGLAYDSNRNRLIVIGLPSQSKTSFFDASSGDNIDVNSPLFTIHHLHSAGWGTLPHFSGHNSKITYDNNNDRIIIPSAGNDFNSPREFYEMILIFGRSNTNFELLENGQQSDGYLERVGDSITVKVSTENTMYDELNIGWSINIPWSAFSDLRTRLELMALARAYNPPSEGYSVSTGGSPSTQRAYLAIGKTFQLEEDEQVPKIREVQFRFPLPGEWSHSTSFWISDSKRNTLFNQGIDFIQSPEYRFESSVRVLNGTILYKSGETQTMILNRTINLGESMTVKAITVDDNVKKVKFTWIRPDNTIARESPTVQVQDITEPITGKGAEDTFTPDQAGDGWKIKIEFQDEDGNKLYVEEVTFNVVAQGDSGGGGGGGGGAEPTYILELSSNGPLVDYGSRDLGSSIDANARTDVGTVNNVVFRWLYIQGNQEQTIREHTAQVSDGRASDTFTPNQAGAWKVKAIFRNNENTLHTIERSFTINPVNNISVSDNQGNSINLNTTQGDNLISLPIIEQPNPDQIPQIPNTVAVNIPYGLLSFAANTSNDEWLTIDIQYPSPLPTLNANQYYAYLKRINGEWKIINMDTSNQDGYFELVNNTTIRLHIRDNGQFDADNRAGIVADPGGIAILQSYNYGAGLLEDGDPLDPNSQPSDGVISLGEDITAIAVTDNLSITSVRFKWIDPTNNIVRDYKGQPIPLAEGDTIILVSFDTFTPDKTGIWTVITEFSDGTTIVKELNVSFQVVPESIIGAVAVIGSSLAVLALYRRKRAVDNSNREG